MSRTKQVARKNKGSSSKEGSKPKKGENMVKNKKVANEMKHLNCKKVFSQFKFQHSQTQERLVPRATITRCFSPFLRTSGVTDVIIGRMHKNMKKHVYNYFCF